MTTPGISPETNALREKFFRLLFGNQAAGYMCISYLPMDVKQRKMTEEFFKYPEQLPQALESINRNYLLSNAYFSPMLFRSTRRIKESVSVCTALWADLDTCHPDNLLVEPTLAVQSSVGRYQAYWVLETPVEPLEAEALSRRIAYAHAREGADKSGWDLTQLLRVPYTANYKYNDLLDGPPTVTVLAGNSNRYRPSDFDTYPEAPGFAHDAIPFPEVELASFSKTAEQILDEYRGALASPVVPLFGVAPDGAESWSESLWRLQMLLFEAGLTREQVFVVAEESACNKYKRDNRPKEYLWREVCRAHAKHEANMQVLVPSTSKEVIIISDDELAAVQAAGPTFVERYIDWGKGLGDASWQYHQAGAFIALSSLLSGSLRLPTSYGTIVPNLWFMILADTTLTRKTTAMDLATELILDVDPEIILATDGSIEGLMTSLSARPGRPSMFLRDEFSGLLEAMTKKDYYAGMAETLTKLYDGKFMKRILRKETIEVRDPILVMFAGGIKNRVTGLLTHEHVSSGFMPRFVFITAESDLQKVRPLGPPTEHGVGVRVDILKELLALVELYGARTGIKQDGERFTIQKAQRIDAKLSADAWSRYNKLEHDMMVAGLQAEHPDIMTPVHDRLSKSGLKAAMLLAASRQQTGEVIVEEEDVVRAISYVQQWMGFSLDVIKGIGKTTIERELDKVLNTIMRKPGMSRSQLMQWYHLTARQADMIFQTLEQRGQITSQKKGRTYVYYSIKREEQK